MPNNPFADFANALGGALYGDPRQYQLGQFYGQRSIGQNLKNKQLKNELDERAALFESLKGNDDLANAIRSGEGYSSAKFNFGKEQRAGAGEDRLVEGLAEIAKKDPYLANQYKVGRTGSDIRNEANIPGDLAAEARLKAEDTRFTDALQALKTSGNPEDAKLAQQLELQLSGPDIRALNRMPLDEAESAATVAGKQADTLKTKIATRGLRKDQRRKAKEFNQNQEKVNQEMVQARNKNEAQLRELEQKINKETNINEIKKLELNKAKLLSKNNNLEAEVAELEFKKKKKEVEIEIKSLENKTTIDFFKEYDIKRKDFGDAVETEMKRISGTVPGDFASSGIPSATIRLKDGSIAKGNELSLGQVRQLAVYDVLRTMGVDPERLTDKQKKAFGIDKFNRNEIELIVEPEETEPAEKPNPLLPWNWGKSSTPDPQPQSDLSNALDGAGLNQGQLNLMSQATEDQLWGALDQAEKDGNSNIMQAIVAELDKRGATSRLRNAPVNP